MHVHTVFSKHAYSTVAECVNVAKERGLRYLCISDHFYYNDRSLEGKNEIDRIVCLEKRVGAVESGLRVIGSAEFNLGVSVTDWDKLEKLAWRPIGLHDLFVDLGNVTTDEIFCQYKIATKRHNCFVHPERCLEDLPGPILTKKDLLLSMVLLAKENNIFLEVNESTLRFADEETLMYLNTWMMLAREFSCKISLGTDAHYCKEVGAFSKSIELLNRMEYPAELILNCNEDMLQELFEN